MRQANSIATPRSMPDVQHPADPPEGTFKAVGLGLFVSRRPRWGKLWSPADRRLPPHRAALAALGSEKLNQYARNMQAKAIESL